jgi:hypothetical protein
MPSTRQTSFASGELSPLLWGRTDLEVYASGARSLLNFVVNRQGNSVSRPGTQLAWNAKQNDVVLLPFLHASGESYVLELGHLYVRIYNARTLALITELVTPFQSTDLPELQWAQLGSTMVLTHRLRAAQELTITSAATIVPVRYAPPGDTSGAAALQAFFPSIGGNPPSMPVLVSWTSTGLFVVDAAHPPRLWKYKVSVVMKNTITGEVAESLPRDITQFVLGNVKDGTVPTAPGSASPLPADGQLVLFADAPIYIEPGLGDAVAAPANWVAVENLYYRGRGQLFGLVGRCAPNERFADFGDEPDYETPPLRGESPFKTGEYPAAVAFFQQRRCFAGPTQRFWMSAVDEFANHDAPIISWRGQPLAATLINRKRERAVSMVAAEHLLLFTDTSVWCVGRPDVPLDFDTFAAVTRTIDEVGSAPLQPLVIDESVLYARAQGRGVRGLQLTQAGYQGGDVSWHAEHLFRGGVQTPTATWVSARIVSWCFQREPFGTVWAVRSDGTLLTCTRTGDGRFAWSRHDTGTDKVLSVCAVPRNELAGGLGGWDDVFVAVVRAGVTRIERMTPPDIRGQPRYASDPKYIGNPIGSQQLSYPVDSYVLATVTKASPTAVLGLNHLEGRDVWLSCPGVDPFGPLRVTGGQVTTPAGWGPKDAVTFTAAVGLPYLCDLELLDAPFERMSQKTVVSVGFEVDNAVGLLVGEDFGKLVEWRQRTVADSYEYPSAASAFVVVNVLGRAARRCVSRSRSR